MTFSKITIIGLGLIGGSLAWALRNSEQAEEIFGIDVDEGAVEYAINTGIIDGGSRNLRKGMTGSEIVVIATYVGTIPEVAKSASSLAPEGAVITDVGSVKGEVVREIGGFLPPHLRFVGGHPIAGTERSGVRFADSQLFMRKRCILTPTEKTDPEALAKVRGMWETAGARVFTMDPDSHDRIFAFVSHLPHVVAYALINSVASSGDSEGIIKYAGGGLGDFTRIAASSPQMWRDIFLSNSENVLEALGEFQLAIERIAKAIENRDSEELETELANAATVKRNIDG